MKAERFSPANVLMTYNIRETAGLNFTYREGRGCGVTGVVEVLPVAALHEFMTTSLQGEQLTLFLKDTEPVLAQLPPCIQGRQQGSFFQTDVNTGPVPTGFRNTYNITRLSRLYLRVCQRFVNLQVVIKPPDDGSIICGRCLLHLTPDEEDWMCNNCQQRRRQVVPVVRVTSIINIAKEMQDFQDTISMYQGEIPIPEAELTSIFTVLDDYFFLNSIPPRAEICALPADEFGQKSGVSKALMTRALKNFLKPYEDYVNYICTVYWDFPAMTIADVRTTVLSNHTQILHVIEEILVKYGRRLNICNWFMLYMHLKLVGRPQEIFHFRVVKTETVQKIHQAIWVEAVGKTEMTERCSC
jgi:hypothetical protein